MKRRKTKMLSLLLAAAMTVSSFTAGMNGMTVQAEGIEIAEQSDAGVEEVKLSCNPIDDKGAVDKDHDIIKVRALSEQSPAVNDDGPASYAFDGSTDTWWHTRWDGDIPEGGHEIDTGKKELMKRIQFG